jgi:hypothetical protein
VGGVKTYEHLPPAASHRRCTLRDVSIGQDTFGWFCVCDRHGVIGAVHPDRQSATEAAANHLGLRAEAAANHFGLGDDR